MIIHLHPIFAQVSEREIEVTHTNTNTSTKFTAPVSAHKVTPNHNPVSLDITSTGALGAVTNGNYTILSLRSAERKSQLLLNRIE